MRSPGTRPTPDPADTARRTVITRCKVGEHSGENVHEGSVGECMPPQHIGYLTGVFDLFHVGHLDVLERARRECDRLVIGVLTDDWAMDAWGTRPFVPLVERVQIVEHLRCVDEAVVVDGVEADWLTGVLGVQTVFAASGTDGVLGADELDGVAAELVSALPAGPGSRSQILRAAIDQRQSRSSVA